MDGIRHSYRGKANEKPRLATKLPVRHGQACLPAGKNAANGNLRSSSGSR